jgi:DNA-binding CsgD family transcriptional regulator
VNVTVNQAGRLARQVDAACRTGHGPVGVERAVAAAVAPAVPFDAWCVLTVDPATALATGGFHEQGVPAPLLPRLCEIEAAGMDAMALPALVRGRSRVRTLSAATGGEVTRSARYREIFAPSGLEHEMRLLFTTGAGAWGALIVLRGSGSPDFSAAEQELCERATGNVAAAIRRELLLTEVGEDAGRDTGPGLLLLDEFLQHRSSTAAARRWLCEIEDGVDPGRELPYAVLTLAGSARDKEGPSRAVRSRLRARSGQWLTLHAELLDDDSGDVSVIIEPTRPLELAELIADAYRLSQREREVVRLLAIGHSRAEIARALTLSPHTVDDHVKNAFAKVGARSRAELTAKLFFDQHMPRIHDDVPLGGSGWYLR